MTFVINWRKSIYTTHIDHHYNKQRQWDNEVWSVNRIQHENNSQNIVDKPVPDFFLKNQNWAYL